MTAGLGRRGWMALLAVVPLVVVPLAVATASAAAAAPRVATTESLSGPSPFPGPCDEGSPSFVRNSVVEPYLAVDPRDPRHIVVVWTQDDGSTFVVKVTRDGGRHWARVLVPGLTVCTGGFDLIVEDPRVSFGRRGRIYLSGGTAEAGPVAATTTMLTSQSDDGGITWALPKYVQRRTGDFWDEPALTADPRRPGTAYFLYDKRTPPAFHTGYSLLSRTTDGGRTWSPGRVVYDPKSADSWPSLSRIAVARDGSLVNAFGLVATPGAPVQEMIMRSTDGGRTWSGPRTLDTVTYRVPTDPQTGDTVYGIEPNLEGPAVAPDGTIYVVWADDRSTTSSRVLFAKSTDDGRTWSSPRPVAAVSGQAFGPAIAVAGDGTVGVSYYEAASSSTSGKKWPVSFRFATSADEGGHWRRLRVAGPFDYRTAQKIAGTHQCCRIGDYFGLGGLPHGFAAAFVMAKPQARQIQNVFFAHITTGR